MLKIVSKSQICYKYCLKEVLCVILEVLKIEIEIMKTKIKEIFSRIFMFVVAHLFGRK